MKSTFLIGLAMMLTASLSSQNSIKAMPQFKNDILIVKTYEEVAALGKGYVDVSDGSEIKYSTELESSKSKNQGDNAAILAQVFSELKKQKYKLIGTNSAGGGGGSTSGMGNSNTGTIVIFSNYIFQKEL